MQNHISLMRYMYSCRYTVHAPACAVLHTHDTSAPCTHTTVTPVPRGTPVWLFACTSAAPDLHFCDVFTSPLADAKNAPETGLCPLRPLASPAVHTAAPPPGPRTTANTQARPAIARGCPPLRTNLDMNFWPSLVSHQDTSHGGLPRRPTEGGGGVGEGG